MIETFESKYRKAGDITLPSFSGTRVMMMPLVLGDLGSVPGFLSHWKQAIADLFTLSDCRGVGYLTIDEKRVRAGQTHRRAGKHVDGVFQGRCGGWGGGGGWGSVGNGMLTVASHAGCRIWGGQLQGRPGFEGECDHLAPQLDAGVLVQPGEVYWLDGLCVHESVPMTEDTDRQFVRLSMPSTAPWFEGYTENPLGVQPTGPILPRREFMDA